MSIESFCPEMGQARPAGTDGDVSYAGSCIFICTPLELKGRGITYLQTYRREDLTTTRKVGWHSYRVTTRALADLRTRFTFAHEAVLN